MKRVLPREKRRHVEPLRGSTPPAIKRCGLRPVNIVGSVKPFKGFTWFIPSLGMTHTYLPRFARLRTSQTPWLGSAALRLVQTKKIRNSPDGLPCHRASPGDCLEGLGRLIPSGTGGQRVLDRLRVGLDDPQQYPGGEIGNRPPLLPLLYCADAEAEPMGEGGLRESELVADRLHIRNGRVVYAPQITRLCHVGGGVRIGGDLSHNLTVGGSADALPVDASGVLTDFLDRTPDDRHHVLPVWRGAL